MKLLVFTIIFASCAVKVFGEDFGSVARNLTQRIETLQSNIKTLQTNISGQANGIDKIDFGYGNEHLVKQTKDALENRRKALGSKYLSCESAFNSFLKGLNKRLQNIVYGSINKLHNSLTHLSKNLTIISNALKPGKPLEVEIRNCANPRTPSCKISREYQPAVKNAENNIAVKLQFILQPRLPQRLIGQLGAEEKIQLIQSFVADELHAAGCL